MRRENGGLAWQVDASQQRPLPMPERAAKKALTVHWREKRCGLATIFALGKPSSAS
jgi:hypothetical protein